MSNEEIQTPEVDETIVEEGTEVEEQTTEEENPDTEDVNSEPDYKEKFSASSREAQRLADELKARDEELERLRKLSEQDNDSTPVEEIYPGFNDLPQDEQENLIRYTQSIENRVASKLQSTPEYTFAKKQYNEGKWNSAFDKVISQRPELAGHRDEFKAKYFKADNVPDNIDEILSDLSKVYLFDHAKDIGAQEEAEKSSRIEIERQKGGDKTPKASRSLEDWQRLAAENPAQFAKQSKQYREDLTSGKLS